MKKWIAFFILLVSSFGLRAESDDANNELKVKLLRQLSQLEQNDTTRLNIYSQIINISRNAQVELYYIDKLLQEAKRMNSKKYISEAYILRMALAYNQYDVEQVNRWMKMLEAIAEKEKLYDLLFFGRRMVIDMMMVDGEYERAIKAAEKMLKEAENVNNKIGVINAYISLSHGYRMTYQAEKGAKVLEKAYKLAYPSEASSVREINNLLIATYESLNDYKNWLKWTEIMDKYLQKDPQPRHRGWKMMVAISYINYYTAINDLENAAKHVQIAEKNSMEGFGTYSYFHHLARYNYFEKVELYEQALAEATILSDLYKDISQLAYSDIIFMKARILEKLKRYDESLAAYREAFIISDSTNIALLNIQTEQVKRVYNADKLELENEQINQNFQVAYLGLMITLIIILTIFAIHTFRVRKVLKSSEDEMRRMAEEMELADVAKEHFLSTISTAISVPLNEVVEGSLLLATDKAIDNVERENISHKLNKTSAELMNLINKILSLSRLESGMMRFKMEDIEIIPFIKEAVILAEFDEKKISFEIKKDAPGSFKVHADGARLQELLNDLLSGIPAEVIELSVDISSQKRSVCFQVVHSILSDGEDPSKDTAVSNEINRLMIEQFKGRYEVDTNLRMITITLPLV